MFTIAFLFFFFNDTPTTEIYTLSLHDPLPISLSGTTRAHFENEGGRCVRLYVWSPRAPRLTRAARKGDRKSTRLNSSHLVISYAVFCLKKKNKRDLATRCHIKLT